MYYFDGLYAKAPKAVSLARYQQASEQLWAHPASVHRLGQDVLSALHSAYVDLFRFFGASDSDTVLFAASPEEAIAQVIQSVWNDMARPSGRNHFLTSCLDEAPIILNFEKITSLGGSHDLVEATTEGMIDLEAFEEAIHPRTQMVCLSWANGLTGVIQPVEKIAKICKERGILLMLEASNLSGLYDMDLANLAPDFVCCSGNSLGGVAGSAAIWIRHKRRLSPLLPCGHDWMHSTACHPAALMALSSAANECRMERERYLWRLAEIKTRFEENLKRQIESTVILFESSERLIHVSSVAFKGVHGELVNWHLNRKNIYTSFGGGYRQQMHYLLKACHVDPKLHHSALSFSFEPSMSDAFIDEACSAIAGVVKSLSVYHFFES